MSALTGAVALAGALVVLVGGYGIWRLLSRREEAGKDKAEGKALKEANDALERSMRARTVGSFLSGVAARMRRKKLGERAARAKRALSGGSPGIPGEGGPEKPDRSGELV